MPAVERHRRIFDGQTTRAGKSRNENDGGAARVSGRGGDTRGNFTSGVGLAGKRGSCRNSAGSNAADTAGETDRRAKKGHGGSHRGPPGIIRRAIRTSSSQPRLDEPFTEGGGVSPVQHQTRPEHQRVHHSDSGAAMDTTI